MSDPEYDAEAEQYAYKITRKLFWITAIGTIAFSGIVILFFL